MPTVTNNSRYLSSHLDPARPGITYPVMKKRTLGGTGLIVGEIGVNVAPLTHAKDVPDAEVLFTLGSALDMQAGVLAVTPQAGNGRGLRLVGQAMRDRRAQAQVVLSLGATEDANAGFAPAAVQAGLEAGLKALATDHVDVLLLENPWSSVLDAADPVWAALEGLKKQGKLRAFGVAVDAPGLAKAALDATPVQVLAVPLNVFNQSHAAVLDQAFGQRVGVLATRPLDSGWLTGRFGALTAFTDTRARWSLNDRVRRAQLQEHFEVLARKSGTTVAQAALQFVLSFHQVACAVTGVSDWHQVIGNVDAGQGVLDPAVVAEVRAFWERELKSAPVAP